MYSMGQFILELIESAPALVKGTFIKDIRPSGGGGMPKLSFCEPQT